MTSVGFVIPDLGRPSGGSTFDDKVVQAWPSEAPPVHPIAVAHPTPPDALAAALRRHPVTVVDGLVGCEHPDVLADAAAAGHATVLLVHLPRPADSGLTEDDRRRLAGLEAAALRAARGVVVPSRWAAADLQRRYGVAGAVVAVPGVAPAPPSQPRARQPHPLVVQVGAIGPLKNQLLTAEALLACRDVDLAVRFVGPVVDEQYAARLTEAVRPLGPRAQILPGTDATGVAALLAGADLLVSVATTETYGLTVTEGLARGLPALVGRGTGAEEALAAGGSDPLDLPGAAVATDDPAELASALRTFAQDTAIRDRWRAAAEAARGRLPRWDDTARTIADVCRAAPHSPAIGHQ
ncbi:glycosyltransferase [Arsenicicoccus sp. oral taxon 190]|uniref:glycosyltransferase n=1 Tax=Arsenicicoccus sp. oral taxon 190 TaxID=1658671 RepID=UPI00067C9B30|nr:glycosyltransferase [Arsenicicoccus sp. oral taxon 190]